MKWPAVIATAVCALAALTACSKSDDSTTPLPSPSPTVTTSEPTVSASEAKKAAEEAKASEEAYAKELRAFTVSIEKAVNAQASPIDKLSTIITEYCKLPPTARSESDKLTILEKFYAANWQAGKWNEDMKTAVEQPGACPQPLPTKQPQRG